MVLLFHVIPVTVHTNLISCCFVTHYNSLSSHALIIDPEFWITAYFSLLSH